MMEERIIPESKPKIQKVELDKGNSDFECYDKSGGKPVHVVIDKETTKGNKSTLAVLPNRLKEIKITLTAKHGIGIVILTYADQTNFQTTGPVG